MPDTRTASVLGYPSPDMEPIIHDMRNDIRFLRRWFDAPRERDPSAITEVTPATVLSTLEAVVESVEPALRFYLNYPTQRLSVFLTNFVDQADKCVAWLSAQTAASRDATQSAEIYQDSCERLCASLREWRSALVIAGILRFDADTPEVQH